MYYTGNYRERVTRYNHKCTDRWLTPPVRRSFDWRLLSDALLMGICVACIIVSAVMILRF